MFDVPSGIQCKDYDVSGDGTKWNPETGKIDPISGTVQCSTFTTMCGDKKYGYECYTDLHTFEFNGESYVRTFEDFKDFDEGCLDECNHYDYRHNTIIFNAFIFAQIFNEYNARELNNKLNCFEGILNNWIFLLITAISILLQFLMVEFGSHYVGTSPLDASQFFITAALGAISIPVGFLQRLIPIEEDPDTFFTSTILSDSRNEKLVSNDEVSLLQEKN